MKKVLFFLIFLLGLFAVAGYFAKSFLQETPAYKVYKIFQTVNRVDETADELGLTQAQRQILREIRDLILQEGENLNDGGGDILTEMVNEFKSDRFNAPKLNSLSGKLVRRIQGILPDIYEKIGEFHATLTPAQKTKIVAILEDINK